jgi:hypothetical protein
MAQRLKRLKFDQVQYAILGYLCDMRVLEINWTNHCRNTVDFERTGVTYAATHTCLKIDDMKPPQYWPRAATHHSAELERAW